MRRFLILYFLAVSALLFPSCSYGRTANITHDVTVSVTGGVSKTIGYDGSLSDGERDITHYQLAVLDSKGKEIASSDETELTETFRVDNLMNETYEFVARGLIKMKDGSYHIVAADSREVTFTPSMDKEPVIEITLETLAPGNADDISVDFYLSDDVVSIEGTAGTLSVTLYPMTDGIKGDAAYTWEYEVKGDDIHDIEKELPVSADGSETALVTKHAYSTVLEGIRAGAYLIEAVFTDNGAGNEYTAMDLVRAFPGLPAEGAVDLSSKLVFSSGFTVSDLVGEEIIFSPESGSYLSDDGSVTISFADDIPESINLYWFVDGHHTTPEERDGAYIFSDLADGDHRIVAVAENPAFEVSAGSVVIHVSVDADIEISAPGA